MCRKNASKKENGFLFSQSLHIHTSPNVISEPFSFSKHFNIFQNNFLILFNSIKIFFSINNSFNVMTNLKFLIFWFVLYKTILLIKR